MKILEMQDNGELAKMKHKWFVAVFSFLNFFAFRIYNARESAFSSSQLDHA